MFSIDDRWELWVVPSPPIEIEGFKMIDVSRTVFLRIKISKKFIVPQEKFYDSFEIKRKFGR